MKPWLGAAALALAGCAWGPGEPMGEFGGELQVAWRDDPARAGADGYWRLASDFEVKVTSATVPGGALRLLGASAASAAFDPANPPEGYSLCHNGHCHAADGQLVTYEEVAARLGGGDAPPVWVNQPVGAVDLLTPSSLRLDCGGAGCELPLGEVAQVNLTVQGLSLAGELRDTRQPPRLAPQPFAVELTATVTVAGDAGWPIDRQSPPVLDATIAWRPHVGWLDAVAWHEWPGDAMPLAISDGSEAATSILERITADALELALSRSE